jgi:hypothetical protein
MLLTSIALVLACSTSSASPVQSTKTYRRGEPLKPEHLGKINLESALQFNQKLLENAYGKSVAALDKRQTSLDYEPYHFREESKTLTFRYGECSIIYDVQTGKYIHFYMSESPGMTAAPIDDSAAVSRAESYFRFIGAKPGYKTVLSKTSDKTLWVQAQYFHRGIPIDSGPGCSIRAENGIIKSGNAREPVRIDTRDRVKISSLEATENGALALSSAFWDQWLSLLPQGTSLRYRIATPRGLSNMNSEQMQRSKDEIAIPTYLVQAHDLFWIEERERFNVMYFAEVDARDGSVMIATGVETGDRFLGIYPTKPSGPWGEVGLRIHDGANWRIVPKGELVKVDGQVPDRRTRPVTIASRTAIYRLSFDPESGLLWDAGSMRWIAQANKPLTDALKVSAPASMGFGKIVPWWNKSR